MATQSPPALIDPRLLKALSHPTRQLILDVLSTGPSSPVRIWRRMDKAVSLNLVSHHIKVLRELGCIELIDTVPRRGATEHIYRAAQWAMLSAEQWEQVEPEHRFPITANLLRLISEDTNRALAEGRIEERLDNHLSRSPVELDQEGWSEVVAILARTLDEVLEAHTRSAERAHLSGEELRAVRVVIMQYLIGREGPGGSKGI